jgi:hypothetical protein
MAVSVDTYILGLQAPQMRKGGSGLVLTHFGQRRESTPRFNTPQLYRNIVAVGSYSSICNMARMKVLNGIIAISCMIDSDL